MINIWFCNAIVLSGAGYLNPLSSIDTMTSDENNHRCPCRAPGTLRNLQITLADALTGGGTRTFTLRKNGADTAITIAMSGTGTTDGEDLTHTVTVAAGDELSIHQTTTFSPASTFAAVRMEFEADADGTSVYGAGGTNPQYDATTRYAPLLCGQVGRNDSSEPINAALACLDGTITDLDVRITAAPTSGKSRTFVIFKNGVAQDGTGGTPNTTVTIANTATSGTANFSLTVAALDLLSLRCSSSGSPGNAGVQASSVFVSDSGEGQHITLTDDASLPTSGTQYNTAFGANLGWGASARLHAGAQTTLALQHIHAVVSLAPGVGKSWVFTLQKNGADTVLTTTISGTATENAFAGDDLVQIGAGDTFRIRVDAAGTPAALSHAKVTFFPFTVETILGSAVFGTATTVTATLAIAMGLDGDTHVDDTPHTLTVYGDLHVTGDTVIDGTTTGGGPSGPVSSTDKAIVRWSGTGGDTLEDSTPTVEDDGRIANLTDPTGAQDAATKAYVDGAGSGASVGTGGAGSEPGSPAAGDLYLPDNSFYLERYSGSAWVPWGPIFPMVDPALAGLSTWVNQGSATVDTTNGGIYLATPAQSGDNLRIRLKTAPATPYTITAALLPVQSNVNFLSTGLIFRQSSDGKTITLDLANGAATGANKWTSATAYNSGYTTTGSLPWAGLMWLRITDNGTNRILSLSKDGQHWTQIHSVGRTDFLTADQVGIFVSANNGTSSMVSAVTLLSWKET